MSSSIAKGQVFFFSRAARSKKSHQFAMALLAELHDSIIICSASLSMGGAGGGGGGTATFQTVNN